MVDEIKETDDRMNKLIKSNNGYQYKGTSYIESEQKQLKGNNNEGNENKDTDVFNSYGFGITSWFSLLQKLMMVYAVISIPAVGLMMEYGKGSELISPMNKAVAKYSLGNLGFSISTCTFTFFGLSKNEEEIKCSRGLL